MGDERGVEGCIKGLPVPVKGGFRRIRAWGRSTSPVIGEILQAAAVGEDERADAGEGVRLAREGDAAVLESVKPILAARAVGGDGWGAVQRADLVAGHSQMGGLG